MPFKFQYRIILKVSEKLVITVVNLFVYYLIIEINNIKSFFITRFISQDIIYQIFHNVSNFNINLIKLKRKIRSNKYIFG